MVPLPLPIRHPGCPVVERPEIRRLCADRTVEFADGSWAEEVDEVLLATGYRFALDFLDSDLGITVSRKEVAPTFMHLCHPSTPTLSFVGLPTLVAPFPLMDCQARAVESLLSGRCTLANATAANLGDHGEGAVAADPQLFGTPSLAGHRLGMLQFDYCRRLAFLGGFMTTSFDKRLGLAQEVYEAVSKSRPTAPGAHDAYRDTDYRVDWEQLEWRSLPPTPTA